MAILKPNAIREAYGLTICEKIIPDGNQNKPNRAMLFGKPKYVTIHNTDRIKVSSETTMAEQYVRATYNGAMSGVSVHYYLDADACWQMLRENEIGYHAADGYWGTGNCRSIAIEIIMDGSGDEKDRFAEERGALLAAAILHRHGLGIDALTTHKRWYPKKDCPAYILPHWEKFKRKVEILLGQLNGNGDIDGDGAVTSADARLALRAAVKLEKLDSVQSAAADVDKDGKITSDDAREILRRAVGKKG